MSFASRPAGFAPEDLLKAVEPAAHAKDGVNPCLQDISLSCLTEGQHGDNSENSLPNMTADTGFHAAFNIKLPPILCNGTAMVQSTYL